MGLRFIFALWAAKLSIPVLKITGHNATDFPGHLAIKLCPDFFERIDKPKTIIAVTGTNGKTTCTNMICDAFEAQGKKVLCNRYGSNIATGLSTCLLHASTLTGKAKHEIAVLEIDERSAPKIFPYVVPQYLCVTNLFRDSIMRNGHPDYIAGILNMAIPPSTKLILNADDLISGRLALGNDRAYYGIEKMDTDVIECENLLNDMRICPICGNKLVFDYRRYHHIGRAHCSSCDFKSPDYDYSGHNIDTENNTIMIRDKDGDFKYHLSNNSIFNTYNTCLVVALFRELGIKGEELVKIMESVKIPDTRYNVQKAGSISVVTQLAKDKNALAVSRATDYVRKFPGHKKMFLLISCYKDERHWSENTCWLYDCDFEMMNDPLMDQLIVTGPRAPDFYMRLLFAGIPEEKIFYELDEHKAAKEFDLKKDDTVYIFCGIDAFDLVDECRQIILKRAEEEGL